MNYEKNQLNLYKWFQNILIFLHLKKKKYITIITKNKIIRIWDV
jgi:hypothetical protein